MLQVRKKLVGAYLTGITHLEHEFPRTNYGDPNHVNFLDAMDSIFTVFPQEFPNITQEKL
jgi:hypothetical protein